MTVSYTHLEVYKRQVLHGLPSTLQVSMEMMLMHGQSVARGLSKAMMVIDMPFGAYEEGREQAFRLSLIHI